MADLEMKVVVWCRHHKKYEDGNPCFKICEECFHVFPTEEALLADVNEGRDPKHEPVGDVSEINHCPHCVHDW